MINRILKNRKTTLLGLSILTICFILVFLEKATLTEVSGFICGGFFVLFSKDSILRKKGPVNIIIVIMLLFTACRPYRSFTSSTEHIVRDTVVIRDSILLQIKMPGDTVLITSDSLVYDTIYIDLLRSGHFTLPPWEASAGFAYAQAGITNSVPWLNLRQQPVTIDTLIYVDKIKILEQTIREMQSKTIVPERDPFYKNVWLWMSVILGLLLFNKYARN